MPLDDLQNTISNLEQFDWGQELESIVENNTDAIIQLQEEQLYSGVDSNNQQITLEGQGYAKKTFDIKTEKGQPTDRITWKDTGALYNALTAKVDNGNVTFDAPGEDEKFEAMIFRSGIDILGLNEDFRTQFGNNVTLPAIRTVFNQKTGFEIQ